MKHHREPDYRASSPIDSDPILIDFSMDLRLYLRIDLRTFLRVHHMDPQSGEPTPEQLQQHFAEGLVQILLGQEYTRDARATWIVDDAIL